MAESLRFLNQSAPKRPCLGAGGGPSTPLLPPLSLCHPLSTPLHSCLRAQHLLVSSSLSIFAHSFRYQSEVSSSEPFSLYLIFPGKVQGLHLVTTAYLMTPARPAHNTHPTTHPSKPKDQGLPAKDCSQFLKESCSPDPKAPPPTVCRGGCCRAWCCWVSATPHRDLAPGMSPDAAVHHHHRPRNTGGTRRH